MPRTKTTKKSQNQNSDCNTELNDTCNYSYNNEKLQHSENSCGEFQYDQSCDTASSRFETEFDSESTQYSHTSFHENSSEQSQWDQTCEMTSNRVEAESNSISESSQKKHTNFYENSSEQMQWNQTYEATNNRFEIEADSVSTTRNIRANFHDTFNELQLDQICETGSSQSKTEADSTSESTLNNHTKFQSTLECETSFKQTQNWLTHLEIEKSQIHNCHKNTNELPPISDDFQENRDFKPNILLDIKIEPTDNDSNSEEHQDFPTDLQQNQNHPSDSMMEAQLDIKPKICDMHSNLTCTQDCHEQSTIANGLQIKSEPYDINSAAPVSECSKEVKLHSESSDEACDREIDHSNNSSTVEVKSEKPDPENDAVSPPNQDLKRSRRSK